MFSEGKYKLVPYLFLFLVVVLLYANTLFGGFVWDDNLFTSNQVYWNFDFGRIFFSLANGLEYQPVRDITYLFDIAVWQGSPFGFHLTNLLLFVATVILAYKVTESLSTFIRLQDNDTPGWLVPLLATLIFTMHPQKSEVVAWVTQRNTLLATFFFLLSFFWFLRYQDKGNNKAFTVSLVAFFLAILSKAIAVTLPLLLLFFTLVKKRGDWRRSSIWLPLAPFFALSGAVAAMHIAIAGRTTVISAAYYGSFGERLSVALQIPFFYLEKTLLPTDLSAFYAENFAQSLTSARVLLSIVLLTAMITSAWLLRKKCPEILLGGGWFIITLLPVSNLLATSPVAADRYIFLPSVGLAFTAATLISRIRLPLKAVISLVLLYLCLLAVLTFKQNRIWHDDISLWSQTAVRSPHVAGVWFNLGRAFHRTPQLGMALDAYLRAYILDTADNKSLDNAAALFPSSRGSIAARHELVKSLADQLPPYPAGLALIGYTDSQWQHPEAAEELFLYLLAADKQSLTLQLALANLYRKLGAFDRAISGYTVIISRGQGRGEAEFGLASIAAVQGSQQRKLSFIASAKAKGGVPEQILSKLK